MKAKECMSKDVTCAMPQTPLYVITEMMKDNQIGCVPICNESKFVVGLLTDRDILLRAIASNRDIKNTSASEIMTKRVFCCNTEDTIETVQSKMSEYQVRRIPVVEANGKIAGIITMGDIANLGNKIGKTQVGTTFENICNKANNVKNCN